MVACPPGNLFERRRIHLSNLTKIHLYRAKCMDYFSYFSLAICTRFVQVCSRRFITACVQGQLTNQRAAGMLVYSRRVIRDEALFHKAVRGKFRSQLSDQRRRDTTLRVNQSITSLHLVTPSTSTNLRLRGCRLATKTGFAATP
jgi:hypothetical protein